LIEDVTGGEDEPKRSVVPRRRGLGKGLGAILPAPGQAVEQLARRDPLTGLPNRSLLDERFVDAMARCREDGASLAVLVVALDGFGNVNELFGHRVGDDLLNDAAARLSAARRKTDTVTRFAGDEFVLVCPYVESAELACRMAARILEDVGRPTSIDGVEHRLSASIGVVVTTPTDTGEGAQLLETLLGDALLAMRLAKDEGGASWKLFDPRMRQHAEDRHQNRQDLRAAMDDDGLVLEYEPIIDLVTGAAIGESALLGWRNPEVPFERPQAMLDLVDEAGLAGPIGRWMLDEALSDINARRAGSTLPADFRVWVKVAPSLVADPTFVESVDELTSKHGVHASMVGLDIGELSPAALASAESTLRALEERGVMVALDDFGAGPSNLALLQGLPVTALKLAPELVGALGDDGHAAALLRGLLELGRALGLTLVAQGVESEAQAMALQALGYQFAQGPFLGDQGTLPPTPDPALAPEVAPEVAAPVPPAVPAREVAPEVAPPVLPAAPDLEVAPEVAAPVPTTAPAAEVAPEVAAPTPAPESLWAAGTIPTGPETTGSSTLTP
jgi:diguanylate cyclase (GGDEF)-like protein